MFLNKYKTHTSSKMKFLLTLCTFFIVHIQVFGQLGENRKYVVSKFGEPFHKSYEENGEAWFYQSNQKINAQQSFNQFTMYWFNNDDLCYMEAATRPLEEYNDLKSEFDAKYQIFSLYSTEDLPIWEDGISIIQIAKTEDSLMLVRILRKVFFENIESFLEN